MLFLEGRRPVLVCVCAATPDLSVTGREAEEAAMLDGVLGMEVDFVLAGRDNGEVIVDIM